MSDAKHVRPSVPVRKLSLEERLKTFAEVLQTYLPGEARQEARRWADFDIVENEWADACPMDTDIRGFVEAAAQGDFDRALKIMYRENPFPRSFGRFCHRYCERKLFKDDEEALQIRALERAVGELGTTSLPVTRSARATGKKVAAIGSGPASLALAYFLRLRGHAVTIFEQHPIIGGLIALGVPNFRFERKSFVKESDVEAWGAKLVLNQPIDRSFFERLSGEYDAVFVAAGRSRSMELKIPGMELDGVYDALFYLREYALGHALPVGKKVAIIGGGYSSLDVARTVLRLGSEPTVIYRRTRSEMPVSSESIERAEEEGVIFCYQTGARRILGDRGRARGLECHRLKLLEPGRGRESPLGVVEGSTFSMDADTVVPAIGQEVDLSFLNEDICVTSGGLIAVERPSYMTSRPGVFAAGDIAGDRGIDGAYFAGKKAALAIDAYLNGEPLPTHDPHPTRLRDRFESEE